jgi:hypothetical protein
MNAYAAARLLPRVVEFVAEAGLDLIVVGERGPAVADLAQTDWPQTLHVVVVVVVVIIIDNGQSPGSS